MKSRIFFFLSLVAFFNPISVMAEGLRSYKIDSKMVCGSYIESRKEARAAAGAASVKTKKETKTSGAAG